jgi:hypothetical protein
MTKTETAVKVERKDLPDVLETGMPNAQRAVMLLEEGYSIKTEVGVKADEKKGKAGTGLLGRLSEVQSELEQIQFEGEVDGLRHGSIVFASGMRSGRKTLNTSKLMVALIERGVAMEVWNEAVAVATKTGDDYAVRELEVLK